MRQEIKNIKDNLKVIQDRATEDKDSSHAPPAIKALDVVTEIIKQSYFEDLVGGPFSREIRLFGGKLTIKVFHEPHRNK